MNSPDKAHARIEFTTAVLSATQIDHLAEFVTANKEWLALRGIDVHAWGSTSSQAHGPHTGGPFEITFDGAGKIGDEIHDRFSIYGPGTVTFVRGRV
jgi:hypothetical protein